MPFPIFKDVFDHTDTNNKHKRHQHRNGSTRRVYRWVELDQNKQKKVKVCHFCKLKQQVQRQKCDAGVLWSLNVVAAIPLTLVFEFFFDIDFKFSHNNYFGLFLLRIINFHTRGVHVEINWLVRYFLKYALKISDHVTDLLNRPHLSGLTNWEIKETYVKAMDLLRLKCCQSAIYPWF